MLLKDVIIAYRNHSTEEEVYSTFTGFCKRNGLKHNTMKAYITPFEYFDKKTNTHYRIKKKEVIR